MFGVKKVAEGVTNPENTIPLDINHNKLLVWLVDRKQVPSNWNTELEKLEQELEYAKGILPDHLKSQVKDDLWYNRIEEILREVEKEEKGWTGSSQGRAWRRVMKHLKYKNLFLAHSARLLISLINYEIPSLNKRLERAQKQVSEHRRKQQEYKRIAAEQIAQFKQDCTKYEIEGENINQELSNLVTKLPEYFKTIVDTVKEAKIDEIISFYGDFVRFISGDFEKNEKEICSMLTYVFKYGNESLETKRKRDAGEDVESDGTDSDHFILVENPEDEEEIKVGEIKWDDDDDVPMGTPGEIQWDVDEDIPMGNAVEINWDDGEDVPMGTPGEIQWDITDDTSNTGTESMEGGIVEIDFSPNWEISVEDNGLDVQVEEVPEDEKLPTGLILENSISRNEFLDDLLELQSFLKQRKAEMGAKDDLVIGNILQKAPKHIASQNLDSIDNMLTRIKSIIDLLFDSKFRMIVEIKASKLFTERLTSGLKKKLDTANRMKVLEGEVKLKEEEVEENTLRLQLERVALIKEGTEIKAHLQHHLSKALSRPVNIMGEIHNILGLK